VIQQAPIYQAPVYQAPVYQAPVQQSIRGESRIEQVPYERSVIDYEPVERTEYVAKEK